MIVSSLGYIVVETHDVARWRTFGVDTLGLAEGISGADGSLRLRIDERPFRVLVVPGERDRFLAAGWELRDEATFAGVVERLRSGGVDVRDETAADASARCVTALASCLDPCGNRVEIFHGRFYDYQPFGSARGLSGFITGDQGMGHVVLPAPQLSSTREFYKRYLGFGDSDEMWLQMTANPADPKLGLHFLHADNSRHHSLALVGAPSPSGCVHIMLQARSLDDVGHALDRCMAAGEHITSTLGKHSNDQMVSFYVATPGGFDLEFGWGAISPDWATWIPTHSLIPDLWGHKWSPAPSKRAR